MSKAKAEEQGVGQDEHPMDFTHPGWSDHVMSQFTPDELQDGNPKYHGLRRLAETYIGPITASTTTVAQSPNPENGYTAVVVAEITFWDRNLNQEVTFAGEADVNEMNAEPAFHRFASATAGTRARARACKEALRISKVSDEELTKVKAPEAPLRSDAIRPEQVVGIRKTCQDLGIDLNRFINSGGGNYADVTAMSKDGAARALGVLNKYFQKPEIIPENLKNNTGF